MNHLHMFRGLDIELSEKDLFKFIDQNAFLSNPGNTPKGNIHSILTFCYHFFSDIENRWVCNICDQGFCSLCWKRAHNCIEETLSQDTANRIRGWTK